MTTAVSRPDAATGVTPDTTDAGTSPAQSLTSGWYDPDGAGWEAASASAFEAFRATPAAPRMELLGDEDLSL